MASAFLSDFEDSRYIFPRWLYCTHQVGAFCRSGLPSGPTTGCPSGPTTG